MRKIDILIIPIHSHFLGLELSKEITLKNRGGRHEILVTLPTGRGPRRDFLIGFLK